MWFVCTSVYPPMNYRCVGLCFDDLWHLYTSMLSDIGLMFVLCHICHFSRTLSRRSCIIAVVVVIVIVNRNNSTSRYRFVCTFFPAFACFFSLSVCRIVCLDFFSHIQSNRCQDLCAAKC